MTFRSETIRPLSDLVSYNNTILEGSVIMLGYTLTVPIFLYEIDADVGLMVSG